MGRAYGSRFGLGFPIRAETHPDATDVAGPEKSSDPYRLMTDSACAPLRTSAPIAQRERDRDRFAELLECMADLLVETRRQHEEISQNPGNGDPLVTEAIARLAEMERSLEAAGIEAAGVHQLLQHLHLI
jgi:type VI protein secretion system component VasF